MKNMKAMGKHAKSWKKHGHQKQVMKSHEKQKNTKHSIKTKNTNPKTQCKIQ